MAKAKDEISLDEGRRLKEFRDLEGLSQEQMGVVLGRMQQHVGKLENGTRRIQISDVKKLHLKFNMSYEWFYHGKGFRKYKPDKTSLLKDVSALNTTISILESKVEQLDLALKLLYKQIKVEDSAK